ncbi:helix-turn-helix domain-containing protein [Methylomagnum sp.]
MANPATQPGAQPTLKDRLSINLDDYPDSHLFGDTEAAAVLDTAPGTLSVWRSTGRYNLPFVKIGRKVRYKAGDLRAFLAKRTATHTGQQGTAA